uniref:Uncharacterized protein n=1 Tax=Arundo donax TaxID=35708 RepID=A0A0A9CUX5_ARUDO
MGTTAVVAAPPAASMATAEEGRGMLVAEATAE